MYPHVINNKNIDLKKRERFLIFCVFLKIDREKVFSDVLDTKEAFKDYKNICLWKTQNLNFSKGISPWFSPKIKDLFNFDFYAK